MGRLILAVNPGSSSREYAVYKADGTLMLHGYYEHDNDGINGTISDCEKGQSQSKIDDINKAADHFLDTLDEKTIASIQAVGLRVVAPGRRMLQHQKFDDDLIDYLKSKKTNDPLHIEVCLNEFKTINSKLPDANFIAVSDSAFHSTLSHEARNYAINRDDADAYDIYRFGYHGTSIESVAEKISHKKAIICHLGSGSSITALLNGKSIETSMGYSPLEGLIMATRSGDIDIAAALDLAKNKNLSNKKLIEYLNESAGLLGLSKKSNDIRELLRLEDAHDENAKFALDAMLYRIRQYIGAYAVTLKGFDCLVFTATIGERSAEIRRRLCEGLEAFNAQIDPLLNDSINPNVGGRIHSDQSSIEIVVIPADEVGQIAAIAKRL